MIAPVSLADLTAASRLEATKRAIITALGTLLPGVRVVSHPGKLDMNDVLDKAIVPAPGIALGWSRIRGSRDIGGTLTEPVDWVAYIVVEDFADRSGDRPRLVAREVVGHAIGSQLLRILADPDTASWGLTGLDVVAADPAPQFTPVLTIKTAEKGTAIYAVSWTQALMLEGDALFGGPELEISSLPDGMEFVTPDGETGVPTELLALIPKDASP